MPKTKQTRAREMAQELKALATLNRGSKLNSQHQQSTSLLQPQLQGIQCLLLASTAPDTRAAQAYIETKHPYTYNKF